MTLRNATANDASLHIASTESDPVTPPTARPRTFTPRRMAPLAKGDVKVQVQIMSGKNVAAWHRRMVGGMRTACDVDLTKRENREFGFRIESYADLICEDGCFSPAELAESKRLRAIADAERMK